MIPVPTPFTAQPNATEKPEHGDILPTLNAGCESWQKRLVPGARTITILAASRTAGTAEPAATSSSSPR